MKQNSRSIHVQRDLPTGHSFEYHIGSLLRKSGIGVFIYSNQISSTENSDTGLILEPDISIPSSSITQIECSWRDCAYFQKKEYLSYSGIPHFKYENYAANRKPNTLIILGHAGEPSTPEAYYITNLQKFIDYGRDIHYKPFESNFAKHSPKQRILNHEHFNIFNKAEEVVRFFKRVMV